MNKKTQLFITAAAVIISIPVALFVTKRVMDKDDALWAEMDETV